MLEEHFKSVYQAVADPINVGSGDLIIFCKYLGGLDFRNMGFIRRSGPFVRPTEGINKRKKMASQESMTTSRLAAKKKEYSRGNSPKAQHLPPHNPP